MKTSPTPSSAAVARIRQMIAVRTGEGTQKSAAESDPRMQGTVTAPKGEGDDASKSGLPASAKSTTNSAGGVPDGVTSETKPGGAGENVPAVAKTTEPNIKAAADGVAGAAARLAQLLQGNSGNSTANGNTTKAAADVIPTQFSPDMLIKLASCVLADEEGAALAERVVSKQIGVNAASELIKQASAAHRQLTDYNTRYAAAVEMARNELADDLEAMQKMAAALPEAERDEMLKIASVHGTALSELAPELHTFYKAGAADAEAMAGGQVPEGAGEDISPEEILAVLQLLVEQGAIPPEEAQQIAASLQGGAPPEGGAGGAPPDAAAADAAAGGGDATQKEASAAADAALIAEVAALV